MSSTIALDPVIALTLRASLALLLAAAAWHKWSDRAAFGEILTHYELLPRAFVGLVSLALPACELALAVALLLPGLAAGAALASAALLLLYTIAIGVNLARERRDVSCGCLWGGGPTLRPALLVRNGVLIAAACAAGAPVLARTGSWLDAVTIAAATLAAVLLYLGADLALAQGPRLAQLRAGEARS